MTTRRPALRCIGLLLMFCLFGIPDADHPLHAQPNHADSTTTDTSRTRPWYDTLQVTQPRYAGISDYERLALSAFTAVALPVSIIVGAGTLVPPGFGALIEGDSIVGGIAFSSGVGIGGRTGAPHEFPTARVQLEVAYYFERERPVIARGLVMFDRELFSIHPRDFFWLGVSGGGGIGTDFRNAYPFLEGWFGIMNPLGLRYITLFPMHNYGIRLRAGYAPDTERAWYEIAISATSTF